MRALGYEVATVTYDAPQTLRRFDSRRNIAYPTLSDQRSTIIRAFGLLNENYPPDSPYFGVPHPAIVVLDAQGTVSHRFSEAGYVRRPSVDDVLAVLRRDTDGNSTPQTEEGRPEKDGLLTRLFDLIS